MIERSLVLIKHDGVYRELIGTIINRFERVGLKITAMKIAMANEKLAKEHYKVDEEWARNVFEKTKKTYETERRKFEHRNHVEFGKMIQKWNVSFLKEGPVVAMILEGPSAIEIVRKIVGNTEPKQAMPGTIRGDYAVLESYKLADTKSRVLRNLVHASDSVKNAEKEIKLWFNENEIYEYSKELDKHFR